MERPVLPLDKSYSKVRLEKTMLLMKSRVIVNIGKRVSEYGLGGQSKCREYMYIFLSGVQELFSTARLSAEKCRAEAYCDAPAVASQPRIGQAGRNNRNLRLPITFHLFSQLDEAGLEGKKGFQVCFRRRVRVDVGIPFWKDKQDLP